MRQVQQDFTVNEEHYEFESPVGVGYLLMFRHDNHSGDPYWTGEYYDRRGIVTVYRQPNLTRLDVVTDGRVLHRSWRRNFGNRTITKLARSLLTERVGR